MILPKVLQDIPDREPDRKGSDWIGTVLSTTALGSGQYEYSVEIIHPVTEQPIVVSGVRESVNTFYQNEAGRYQFGDTVFVSQEGNSIWSITRKAATSADFPTPSASINVGNFDVDVTSSGAVISSGDNEVTLTQDQIAVTQGSTQYLVKKDEVRYLGKQVGMVTRPGDADFKTITDRGELIFVDYSEVQDANTKANNPFQKNSNLYRFLAVPYDRNTKKLDLNTVLHQNHADKLKLVVDKINELTTKHSDVTNLSVSFAAGVDLVSFVFPGDSSDDNPVLVASDDVLIHKSSLVKLDAKQATRTEQTVKDRVGDLPSLPTPKLNKDWELKWEKGSNELLFEVGSEIASKVHTIIAHIKKYEDNNFVGEAVVYMDSQGSRVGIKMDKLTDLTGIPLSAAATDLLRPSSFMPPDSSLSRVTADGVIGLYVTGQLSALGPVFGKKDTYAIKLNEDWPVSYLKSKAGQPGEAQNPDFIERYRLDIQLTLVDPVTFVAIDSFDFMPRLWYESVNNQIITR